MINRPRLGLLARVTTIYALGALLLSSTVAVATFALVQRQLIVDLEEQAQLQAFRNTRRLGPNLQRLQENPEPPEPLEEGAEVVDRFVSLILDTSVIFRPNGALVLIIPSDGQARSLSGLEARDIPADLQRFVVDDQVAEKRFNDSDGNPLYGIGLRFPDLDIEYYEIVPMTEVANTLSSLRVILIGVSLGASLLGALLGYYSARRALQPLSQVGLAAGAIAGGDFSARLDPTVDPSLRQITETFNEMADALQRRVQRDERFTSDVSHELRSPLMTLSASVEVIDRRRAELPEPAQQAVDLLKKDLTRFQRLVEDLLEISRMDVGAVELDRTPIILGEFLSFVVAQSQTPGVPIKPIHRDDNNLVIMADKRRLAQAITNLIDNAAKYAGGATDIRFGITEESVQITVEDRGPGVAPEDRERIFDRFTRAGADAGRRDVARGVGLGLSLVTEHIRLHQGEVRVADRRDGSSGARFVVQLPIDDVVESDEELAV